MFRGGKILAPSPINFAWWAELNDTTLDFLAPPEHPKTPLPVGHQKLYEKSVKSGQPNDD